MLLCYHYFSELQDISEIETAIDHRKKKYANFQLTLQPCMFKIVTSNEFSYYLVLENLRYEFPTFMKCLDVTFKIHQVFNLQYNKGISNIWLFIQRSLYGIQTIYDTRSPKVSQLEKSLKDALVSVTE